MTRWLKRLAVATSVLLVFGVGAFMCSRVAERGRFASESSTFSAGPMGARALMAWAEANALHPQRLTQDFGRLPQSGMLVALGIRDAHDGRAPTQAEQTVLMRFVARGGIVLVAGATKYLPRNVPIGIGERPPPLGVERDHDDSSDEDVPDAPLFSNPDGELPPQPMRVVAEILGGIPGLSMRGSETVFYDESQDVTVLLERDAALDLNGEPSASSGVGATAVVYRHGRGAIIAFASPSLFQNRDLVDSAGGVVFARLIREFAPHGPVVFDEYHLGIGERRSIVKYVSDFGAGAIFFQLLVIAAFAIVRSSSSLGPPMAADIPAAGGTASYVNAIGTLYNNSKDAAAAARVLLQDALRRIARFHSVPMSGSAQGLVEELERNQQQGAASAARALISLESAPMHNATNFAAHVDAAVRASTTALTSANKE